MMASEVWSYTRGSNLLYRTDLATEQYTCYQVPSYQFKDGCLLNDLHGSLIITGGSLSSSETVRIDVVRDFAAYSVAPMLTPRAEHCAVVHGQHLYVFGGNNAGSYLPDCERFVQNRWEALPPLPRAGAYMSGVQFEGSLYALGGTQANRLYLNFIQKFTLEELTWQLLQVRLPHGFLAIPSFVVDSKVYVLMNKVLYCFLPQTLQVQRVKSVWGCMPSKNGPCYYSRGSLYCPTDMGVASRVLLGQLK
jgi:hypothetical protein